MLFSTVTELTAAQAKTLMAKVNRQAQLRGSPKTAQDRPKF
jgi:hypothetical protein